MNFFAIKELICLAVRYDFAALSSGHFFCYCLGRQRIINNVMCC